MKITDLLRRFLMGKTEVERLHEYALRYAEKYGRADVRVVRGSVRRFGEFLETAGEPQNIAGGLLGNTAGKWFYGCMADEFYEFLLSRARSAEGAKSYFGRFRTMCNRAVTDGVIKENPCRGVRTGSCGTAVKKAVLTLKEIARLMATRHTIRNGNVCRAFLFALFTGIRLCDIRRLRYADIDYGSRALRFEQHKTRGKSGNSGVTVMLNDILLQLLGEGGGSATVFPLPSRSAVQKNLDRWMQEAGINKRITFHCARHSAAVNLLLSGTDIYTVQQMLGHSSMKMTERYLYITDQRKTEAIERLTGFLTAGNQCWNNREIHRTAEQ